MNKSSKIITRLIVSVLTASMMCGFIASCADNKKSEGAVTTDSSTATDDQTSGRLTADVPVKDFDGYVFNALYWSNSGWAWRRSKDIYAEEGSGDTIADAVYKRNLAISEKYNISFLLSEEDASTLNSSLHKTVAAGDDVYTIVCQVQTSMLDMMTNGDLYNIKNIPYIDLTKPWWDHNSVDNYSIANRLYLVSSDITINDKDGTSAIAFSKQAATDNNLPDLYAMVNAGNWTIDNMYDTYKGVARDINGDSKMNEQDFYGFLGGRDVTTTFFVGSGAKIISKDKDDLPVLSVMSDRNAAVLQRLFDLTSDTNTFYNHHVMGTDDAKFQDLFEQGHGLYHWIRLDSVSDMRSSETDFGILPIPKYTEDQEHYDCEVSVYTSSLMSVPVVTKDFERTGILLEALAAESKYTLMYAYYDVALKTKYSRDDQSSAMLDIIIGNRVFDVGDILNPGGMRDLILNMSTQKTFNFTSMYAKLEKSANKALTKLVDKIEALPE